VFELTSEADAITTSYEHQYDRIGCLEDHAIKMSGGVFVLTAAVFTFLARADSVSLQVPWKVVKGIMVLANAAAIFYIWRVNGSIHVYSQRAKAVLKSVWPDLEKIDKHYHQLFHGRMQLRPLIHTLFYILLVAAGLWMISGRGLDVGSRKSLVDASKPVVNSSLPTAPSGKDPRQTASPGIVGKSVTEKGR
jgi:hypothetical protein